MGKENIFQDKDRDNNFRIVDDYIRFCETPFNVSNNGVLKLKRVDGSELETIVSEENIEFNDKNYVVLRNINDGTSFTMMEITDENILLLVDNKKILKAVGNLHLNILNKRIDIDEVYGRLDNNVCDGVKG